MNTSKLVLRFIFSAITWLLFISCIQLPAILIGWILVPLAAAAKAYEPYEGFDGAGTPRVQYRFTWPFMWLFGNEEDGVADNTYSKHTNMFLRIVSWSANRNPANNLRYVKYLSFRITPEKVQYVRGQNWFLCWHGIYSCFYATFWGRELLIGYKVYPSDRLGVPVKSHRYKSVGFGLQFKRLAGAPKGGL